MSTRTLSASVAAATVLMLAACGGDEPLDTAAPAAPPPAPPASTEADTTPTTATTTETAPETTTEAATTETETTETETTATETAVTETTKDEDGPVVIRVEGGQAKGGAKTITVKQGDSVRIRVEVDEPQDIHLHGYELEQEATPEKPAMFKFTAEIEGIFDLETHLTDAKIGKLVVEP